MKLSAPLTGLVGCSAIELAALVRSGEVSATDVVAAHLARIAEVDAAVGAFESLRADAALREAAELDARPDLSELPLAGVPVAIKDNIDVKGEATRCGSRLTSERPATSGHPLVARLRAAGAVVVGKTRAPELCAWPWTNSAFGCARNPWLLDRTPGGSSGGSAAAVAAGMVPLAHGTDGGGSIRIPSAYCGLIGVKAGRGLLPDTAAGSGWHGLSASGPLATTVADAALGLAAMVGNPALGLLAVPDRPLRIALSVRTQMPGVQVASAVTDALQEVARTLEALGHHVAAADPPPTGAAMLTAFARVSAAMADEAEGLALRGLERRNRPMVAVGRALTGRHGWLRDEHYRRFRADCIGFFGDWDALLTPTVPAPPGPASGSETASWLANLRAARGGAFTGAWNVAGLPAMAVPAGIDGAGLPLSVQLVGPPEAERTLLGVAAQIERQRPWRRHP